MSMSELLNPTDEHACGLETWTPEEIFQETQQRDQTSNTSAPDGSEDQVPPQSSYYDLLKSSDVLTRYLRYEESDDSKACVKALRRALREISAAQSKSLVQAKLSCFLPQ